MRVAALLLAALVEAPALTAPGPLSEPAAFATRLLRATAEESEDLRRGRVVVKVLDSPDPTEVMTVAAVRVAAGSGDLAACARDPRCLRGHADLVEVGVFGGAPGPEDMGALTLAPRHESQLRRCEVGRCDLRLSPEAIRRLRREIEKGAGPGAAATLRETLAAHAADYWTGGIPALPVFGDRRPAVSSAESTAELMRRRMVILEAVPALREHLERFPAAVPAGLQQYLYWYKERFHRKLLLGVHHVLIGSAESDRLTVAAAVSRQVYASSYLNAALESVALVADGSGAFLVHEGRARTDVRSSGFTWIERLLLRRLVRGRLEDQLLTLKGRLEASTRPRPVAPLSHRRDEEVARPSRRVFTSITDPPWPCPAMMSCPTTWTCPPSRPRPVARPLP